MAKRMKFDDTGDSDELQALFDSIAATPAKPRLEVVAEAEAGGDSDDLEALFDAVAAQVSAGAPAAEPASVAPAAESPAAADEEPAASSPAGAGDTVYHRLGQMTRQLHDTLRELGYDRALQNAAKAIPDARERLSYIAQMTEQAASRVLNATDIAKPIQDKLQARATDLGRQWDMAHRGAIGVDQFKTLAGETREFLQAVPVQTRATNDQLMEIMMAQDFQDLTGQVIKKIVELAQNLEQQLVQLLLEARPEERKPEAGAEGLLNGPVVNAQGRADVVTSQQQVDDLLDSLGF